MSQVPPDPHGHVLGGQGAPGQVMALDEALHATWVDLEKTVAADITTDPSTFTGTHTFDFGHLTPITFLAEIISLVGDGEVWGAGQLYPLLEDTDGFGPKVSRDGATWYDVGFDGGRISSGGDEWLAGQTNSGQAVVPRYLRVPVTVYGPGPPAYAGVHQPTAAVRVTVSYY